MLERSFWLRLAIASLLLWGLAPSVFGQERLADSQSIRDEQYRQIEKYLDGVIDQADAKRAAYWQRVRFETLDAFAQSIESYRHEWKEFLGVPEEDLVPMREARVRREKVGDFDTHTTYRVWVDVFPGVETYGLLLIPTGATKKTAALVCLHGHRGIPEDLAGLLGPEESSDAYRAFAKTAAERGYVVWVPRMHGLYSEEHEPRQGPDAQGRDILHKKALVVGKTVMGLEIAKLQRGIDYLETLPEVDPDRIGMYGLSKGGHYSLYTAALDTRIKATVVSGWFNHRTRKLMERFDGRGMFWITHIHRFEYYLDDLLHRFGDAELGWMIAPRALLIENGTRDTAVHVDDAREEFQRVQGVYERLGVSDRAQFAAFEGPHRIDGEQAFPFLDKWLGHAPR